MFAISYVAIQVIRSGFMVRAFAGAVWIAGAFLHGDDRLIVWAALAAGSAMNADGLRR